jgi:hypothetical protein
MEDNPTLPSLWRSPMGVFTLVAGAIGVYYLLTEHLAHVTQTVPYLFLLACPLMHLFQGHGHQGHHGHDHTKSGTQPEDAPVRR